MTWQRRRDMWTRLIFSSLDRCWSIGGCESHGFQWIPHGPFFVPSRPVKWTTSSTSTRWRKSGNRGPLAWSSWLRIWKRCLREGWGLWTRNFLKLVFDAWKWGRLLCSHTTQCQNTNKNWLIKGFGHFWTKQRVFDIGDLIQYGTGWGCEMVTYQPICSWLDRLVVWNILYFPIYWE